jgi:hypothetical protein
MKSPDGRECSTFLRHKKITLTGRRTSTLYLLNPLLRRAERVEVDNCVIVEGPRCDWLVRLDDDASREEIYVELKGSDILHAVDQLEATINKLSIDRKRFPKRCLVACSRSPLTGTDVQKYKARFHNRLRASFQVVRDGAEVPL